MLSATLDFNLGTLDTIHSHNNQDLSMLSRYHQL